MELSASWWSAEVEPYLIDDLTAHFPGKVPKIDLINLLLELSIQDAECHNDDTNLLDSNNSVCDPEVMMEYLDVISEDYSEPNYVTKNI